MWNSNNTTFVKMQIIFWLLNKNLKGRATVQWNAANSNKLFGHTFT